MLEILYFEWLRLISSSTSESRRKKARTQSGETAETRFIVLTKQELCLKSRIGEYFGFAASGVRRRTTRLYKYET
jgi:hypothetical protein